MAKEEGKAFADRGYLRSLEIVAQIEEGKAFANKGYLRSLEFVAQMLYPYD